MNEIPEFLKNLSRDINNSPTRCTANPFWQVRHKSLLPVPKGYNDVCFVLTNDNGEFYRSDRDSEEELYEYLLENNPDWISRFLDDFYEEPFDADEKQDLFIHYFDPEEDGENIPGATMVYLQEVEEVVWTGLSEASAKAFISRKQHDYPPLYTYVDSAYWSPDFAELIDWVKGLNGGGE